MNLASILVIIQVALEGLSTVPTIGPESALAAVFVRILQNAVIAYNSAAVAPLDLTKLPIETKVP